MDVVVLCGGLSSERDVSLASGATVANALRGLGHRAVPVDLYFGCGGARPEDVFADVGRIGPYTIGAAAPDLATVEASRPRGGYGRLGADVLEICRAADIVFIALHGEDGEDGKIQALFDLAGVKYTGTGALGSALGMNKDISKQLFRQNGIRTPRSSIAVKGEAPPSAGDGRPAYPCVVKPSARGSSVGVDIVHDGAEYALALENAFLYGGEAVVEQYIAGRECDVGVLGGEPLPVIEIRPKSGFFDYKSKYQSGMADEICPAELSPELTDALRREAARVFEVLKFEVYARMDFIVDGDGLIWCLEGNSLPGLTPNSLLPQEAAAAGISYERLCETILYKSLEKARS
ncbi:MAG: D-alanine--D-alanine ligase [Oscillospiraceae bacterium]|jgi:D-alanine-D-alanine ligase|nr:D-alanine--D-alanine ligase [Oscillospiraceae bacterium]